jgi:hypothetical protein
LALDGLEETHVLDRDDDVIGEGLEEPNLGIAEGTHLVPGNSDRTDDGSVAQHRDSESGPKATRLLQVLELVLGIVEHVDDVHDAALEQRPADHGAALGHVLALAHQALVLRGERREGGDAVHVTLEAGDIAVLSLAELDRPVDHGLKHYVEVEGRLGDRLHDVVDRRGAQLRVVELPA